MWSIREWPLAHAAWDIRLFCSVLSISAVPSFEGQYPGRGGPRRDRDDQVFGPVAGRSCQPSPWYSR